MCGRFTQQLSWHQIRDLYGLAGLAPPWSPQVRYNGAPTQDFVACRFDEVGNRTIAKLHWGLVPSWARDRKMGARLINARAETVHQRPSYSAAFRSRRCLVPANGMVRVATDGIWQAALFFWRTPRDRLSPSRLWCVRPSLTSLLI